jgi:hypothetical protein
MMLKILNRLFSRSKQPLTIRIKLDERFSDTNLQIRYSLADTLEERGIGEVYDEGMGEDFMEVSLDVVKSEKEEREIKSILQSLGLLAGSELIYNESEE